jgi:hypothetical protein
MATPGPVALIVISPDSAVLANGQAQQFTAVLKNAYGAPLTDRTVEWSSTNTAVATVNATGQVIGRSAGQALIIARVESKADTVRVRVTEAIGFYNSNLRASDTLHSVWGTSAGDAYAVGGGGTIVRRDGTVWNQLPQVTQQHLYGVWTLSSTDIYAVGAGGTIVHLTALGASVESSGTTQTLFAVNGTSNGPIAVGAQGTIVRRSGSTWTPMSSGTTQTLNGIWIDWFQGRGYAVGDGGTILSFNGTTWAPMSSPTGARLNDVYGTAANNVYAVGDLNALLHYNGTSWTTIPIPQPCAGSSMKYNGVWAASPTNVYVIGEGLAEPVVVQPKSDFRES